MSLWKQLINLDRRIDSVSRVVSPPTLSMKIVSEGMEIPEPSPWSLTVYIESRDETLGF